MAEIGILRASDGNGNASTATVQSTRSPMATTIQVNTTTNWPTKFIATMGTPHTFTDPVTSETITVISEATAVDFKGHLDGGNIEIDSIAPGYTDLGSSVGDIVIVKPTTAWADEIGDVLDVSLEDDGTLKDDTVDTDQIVDDAITTPKIDDGAVTSDKIDFTTFSGTTTQWRSWTPSFTNFTGTVNVARYTLVGKTCFFYLKVTQGASVTGQHIFSLPVEINANLAFNGPINTLGRGWIQDLGTAQFPAEANVVNSTTLGLLTLTATTTYVQPTATSATVPMTWANGQDSFILQGFYETI